MVSPAGRGTAVAGVALGAAVLCSVVCVSEVPRLRVEWATASPALHCACLYLWFPLLA